ncbi:MAG TPA: phosphate ABC transporter substrate-binding/OmpA family protein [Candidatus Cybelea sp.]|nr:phosphate ABC transporter substrate-binding/OmpA family protein [Candidatus Cybelea sp.]
MTDSGPGRRRGLSPLGVILTFVLSIGVIGLGGWLYLNHKISFPSFSFGGSSQAPTNQQVVQQPAEPPAPTPVEPSSGGKQIDQAATYVPKNNVVEVDISEYAGYGGLIVANGGLAPNPDSYFAKNYGFQVKLSVDEEESWGKLNNGKYAAAATTTDALAVLGRQFETIVPVQIGYSRGSDMIVVDQGVTTINALAGKVVAGSEFNESEFFLRYLASEAGVKVKLLRDLDARPDTDEIGLVFYDDAFTACDAYKYELDTGKHRLNGCVGWTPRTDEVIAAEKGKAKMLVSNRNLLVIADILTVNKGFADTNPKIVKGLVEGLLDGNRRLRDHPEDNIGVVAKAFKWNDAQAHDELSHVHLANLPENIAFFNGTIDAAGSFSGIYQSSVLAYGDRIHNVVDGERFMDTSYLQALQKSGIFSDQVVSIAPVRTTNNQPLEGDPLLKKDIHFYFQPNSADLDDTAQQNVDYLNTIKNFLQVSPGSEVLLRGHVDNARVEEFRKQGGDELVKTMALKAMELSKERAAAVRDALLHRFPNIDPKRIEIVGRGWEEPLGDDSNLNRRVEVQWFTVE